MELNEYKVLYKFGNVWQDELTIFASTEKNAKAIARNEILGRIGSIKVEKVLDYEKTIEPENAQCQL